VIANVRDMYSYGRTPDLYLFEKARAEILSGFLFIELCDFLGGMVLPDANTVNPFELSHDFEDISEDEYFANLEMD
jgi:hypothetical protein